MMKSYHVDATNISLAQLKKKIEATDLVPSRVALLDDISAIFSRLKENGIKTLADLRNALKTKKNALTVGAETGLDGEYLLLLRREIEGYFPKPCSIDAFDWLPVGELKKLKNAGMTDAASLFNSLVPGPKRQSICDDLGVASETAATLFNLSDLTRIQWTSPTTARMLLAAGYTGAAKVARANAEVLYRELDAVNRAQQLFKGTIGLRDVRRLIIAASFVQ